MNHIRWLALLGLALILTSLAAAPHAAAVKLWRLDCGRFIEPDLDLFSDTFAYPAKPKLFVDSCYLIKHGERFMLWDSGLPDALLGLPLEGPGAKGATIDVKLADELKELDVDPKQIDIVALSHYHFDHTGQAHVFPNAKLYMGHADFEALRKPKNEDAKPLDHWLTGGGVVTEVRGDKDIYGDGSVVMLDLPGHTPGHHGLLVKLPKRGYILLSGDVVHFQENYDTDQVPRFNTDRSQSLASMARFKAMAKNLNATVIIQHEAKDVGKLPAFPAFAD